MVVIMKFKPLIIFISIIFSSHIFASNYSQIPRTLEPESTQAYIDLSSISERDGFIFVRTLINFDSPRNTREYSFSSSKTEYEFDCQKRKYRILKLTTFSEKNSEGSITSDKPQSGEWEFAATHDIAREARELVCSSALLNTASKDYVQYAKTSDKQYYYFKPSVKKTGDLYDIIFLVNYIPKTPPKEAPVMSTKYLIKVDCLNREYRIFNETSFSESYGNGKILSAKIFDGKDDWKALSNSDAGLFLTENNLCGAPKLTENKIGKVANVPIVSQATDKLLMLYQPNPDEYFPRIARTLKLQGATVITLYIDKHGLVSNVEVKQPSSSTILDRAAIALGRGYQFNIYTVNGEPTMLKTDLSVKFQ
jgi:TonB family protein